MSTYETCGRRDPTGNHRCERIQNHLGRHWVWRADGEHKYDWTEQDI